MAGEDRKSDYIEKLVAVNRTAKVVKGGRQFGFTALTVVGGLFRIIFMSNFLLAKKIFNVKWRSMTREEIAAATPIPNDPYANKQIGIPMLPVLGRKYGGNSLDISFFIKNKNITPVKAKLVRAIIA